MTTNPTLTTKPTLSIALPGMLYALRLAMMIGSGRTTLPILSTCLIQSPVPGSEILVPTLRFTDLEMDITIPLLGTEGSLDTPMALPMRRLFETMNQLDKGAEIRLQSRDEGLPGASISQYASSCDTHLELFGLPAEEFPDYPNFQSKGAFSLSGISLLSALKIATGATSNDETRVILTGVLIEVEPPSQERGVAVRFLATDTHRIHASPVVVVEEFVEEVAGMLQRIVIPGDLARLLLRVVRDTDRVRIEVGLDYVRVTISQEKTLEGVRDIQIYSRLILGEYPNYKRVVEPMIEQLSGSITVSRRALLSALKRVGIIALQNAKRVEFEIEHGRGYLYLSAQSGTEGKALATIKSIRTTGDMPDTWALNATYIVKILELLTDDEVTFWGVESLRPFVIHGGQPKTGGSWYAGSYFVCMPMQTT